MEQWYFLLRIPFHELDATIQKTLYESYYRFVYRDIYFMLRDHALTEDVIQDAFMKLIAKGPKLHTASNLPGWIKQVTRRTALDYLRKMKKDRQKIKESFVNIERDAFAEISIASDIENKWRNEVLHETIMELKPEYRILLYMYYMEGKTYKEICQELNITEVVLTQRMARARKKLLQNFLGKWVERDE
jgi:RNA polymerase sigma factor, sigma-70 family